MSGIGSGEMGSNSMMSRVSYVGLVTFFRTSPMCVCLPTGMITSWPILTS